MTLILLLMVLLVERVALQSLPWHATRYLKWYSKKYSHKIKDNDTFSLLLFLVAPAVAVGIFLFIFDSRLIDFVVSLFVLAICIGHYPLRKYYRQFLNAQQRKDTEAASILHYKLMGEPLENEEAQSNKSESSESDNEEIKDPGSDNEEAESPDFDSAENKNESVGETLVWINLQYYAAPIFFYVVLGVPGIILYTTVLYIAEGKFIDSLNDDSNQATASKWLEWLLWVPARLVSVGYMFVGHFGRGLEAWLKYSANLSKSSKFVVTQVALAAEGLEKSKADIEAVDAANAEKMVRLAKRNMVLFLVVVALLTLYGQIV